MRYSLPSLCSGILLAMILLGCVPDAPRVNPLDPAHSTSSGIELSGRVERMYVNEGISGAEVRLLPVHLISVSDAGGSFHFTGEIAPGDYTIACGAPGFGEQAVPVTLATNEVRELVLRLNGLPAFANAAVTSHREDSFQPPTQVFLEFAATLDDPDNSSGPADVEQVWVSLPALAITDTLQEIQAGADNRQVFFARVRSANFGVPSAEQLVGLPFQFTAADFPGDTVLSGEHFVARVLPDDPPQTISPINQVTLPETFVWHPVGLPYSFTYRLEVYPNVPLALPPVLTAEGLPAADTTHVIEAGALAPGSYYWVLFAVDDFGNSSRSKQAAIIVE